MFFRLPNYTYLNGLDFLITISTGMNGILVFHLRPLKTSLSGHEWHTCFPFTPGKSNRPISPFMGPYRSGDAIFITIWALSDTSGRKKRPNRPRNGRDRSLNHSSLPNFRAHSVSHFANLLFRIIFSGDYFNFFFKFLFLLRDEFGC